MSKRIAEDILDACEWKNATMTSEEAIDIIARDYVGWTADNADPDWADYPEVGEDDWEAIVNRCSHLIDRPTSEDVTEAQRVLAARAASEAIPEHLRSIVPQVGTIWEWLAPPRTERKFLKVTAVKWDGKRVLVESDTTHFNPDGPGDRTWMTLPIWVQSAVLLPMGHE